jgi:hypothetical protein
MLTFIIDSSSAERTGRRRWSRRQIAARYAQWNPGKLPRWNARVLALMLGSMTWFALPACSETPIEITERLTRMIETERTREALVEINELLIESNRERSVPLNNDPVARVLKRSLDGSVVAWTQEDEFYFYMPDASGSVAFGGVILRDFALSYTGRYAVVLAEVENGCQPHIVSLARESVVGTDELPIGSCYELPAITDDGQFYFYPEKGGLVHLATGQGDDDYPGEAAPDHPPADLPAAKFPPKYPKVTNLFTIEQIGRRRLLIFHGSAGAYNLYYYPGHGQDVTLLTAPGKTLFARARLYSIFEGDTITASSENGLRATPAGNNDPAYGLGTSQAFAYAGGAGKRRLHGLRFTDPPQISQGIPARATQHLVFVRDREEFLILHRDHMSYWNPIRNQRSALPMVARGFVMYSGGLVYIDLLNRLYLRKEPFSGFEMELMRLREAASDEKDG